MGQMEGAQGNISRGYNTVLVSRRRILSLFRFWCTRHAGLEMLGLVVSWLRCSCTKAKDSGQRPVCWWLS